MCVWCERRGKVRDEWSHHIDDGLQIVILKSEIMKQLNGFKKTHEILRWGEEGDGWL